MAISNFYFYQCHRYTHIPFLFLEVDFGLRFFLTPADKTHYESAAKIVIYEPYLVEFGPTEFSAIQKTACKFSLNPHFTAA